MLPTFENIIEHVVKDQLVEYLEREKLLIEKQSDFRLKHSWKTALNLVLANWIEEIENNNDITAYDMPGLEAMICLDLDKEFSRLC